MNFRVTHSTHYSYSEPVGVCWNDACLLPRATLTQKCLTSQLLIEPAPSDLRERHDFFGNRLTHFAIQQPHDALKVTAISEVSVTPAVDFLYSRSPLAWEKVQELLSRDRSRKGLEALFFRKDSPLAKASKSLADYARPSFAVGRPLAEAAEELMQRIFKDFTYDPGVTNIATPLSEVLSTRRGVCQDFAHLGVGCLRAMGLAARYVSGYIETLPPPGKERLIGADASHAWFSVYTGDGGWIDYDPTNNQIPTEQHITVAWGRDFSDVSPLKGVALGGGMHKVSVSVDVARLPAVMTSFQSQSSM